jgi:hypothetical protein
MIAVERHFRGVRPDGAGPNKPALSKWTAVQPDEKHRPDVIYGRNLLGEGVNWITVGVTVRIGDN